MKQTGIYMIQSIAKPERIYIGSAMNIKQRWSRHLQGLKEGRHHSKTLQRHVNKYGKNDLTFTILSCCSKEELLNQEQIFIDSHKPYFNTCMIAGNSLGYKHSEENKQKFSYIAKNRPHISEETREKIRLSSTGRVKTDEERRKRKNSLKGRMPTMKGKHHSEETKQKMRIKATGRLHTDESKKKTGEASKLRNQGVNNPNFGKHQSEDTKRKMSETCRIKRLLKNGTETI